MITIVISIIKCPSSPPRRCSPTAGRRTRTRRGRTAQTGLLHFIGLIATMNINSSSSSFIIIIMISSSSSSSSLIHNHVACVVIAMLEDRACACGVLGSETCQATCRCIYMYI